MALYELTKTKITALDQTTFATQDIDERMDLQRLLRQHIEVIAPGTLGRTRAGSPPWCLVIAEEFCEWDESKRRIDLLGVDRDANLVVIELKRTEDGGHMELQAIRYAAMISALSFSKAVEVYARYLHRNDCKDDAKTTLLQFLNWEDENEDTFGRDVRIVLVSAEFSKEITTSVLWLNERDINIRCVRLRPYVLDGRVLLDVQQVIPLPEEAAYKEKLREKAEETRHVSVERDSSKYDLTVDGTTQSHLTKRGLVFEVVKAALAKGLKPDQIAAKWISVDAEVTSEEFQDRLSDTYDLRRYFCDDGQLFHVAGRTYALSNQWSINTIFPVVDEVAAKLPPGSVCYAKTTEAN